MSDPDANSSPPDVLWRGALRAVAGQEVQRGAPSTSPVARYRDADRLMREVAAVGRLPHAVAPAARLAAPGGWLSTQLLEVPVLFTRSDDGVLRAFINVCRHRGSLVAPAQACASARSRFVCPYHSWTTMAAAASWAGRTRG